MQWYIMIDCWPGYPRPSHIYDEIYHNVLRDYGEVLPVGSGEPVYTFMGEWKWEFDTTQEYYDKVKAVVIHTLKGLYDPDSMAAFLSTGQPQAGIRYYSIGRE